MTTRPALARMVVTGVEPKSRRSESSVQRCSAGQSRAIPRKTTGRRRETYSRSNASTDSGAMRSSSRLCKLERVKESEADAESAKLRLLVKT
jgi:hypothetical protein